MQVLIDCISSKRVLKAWYNSTTEKLFCDSELKTVYLFAHPPPFGQADVRETRQVAVTEADRSCRALLGSYAKCHRSPPPPHS